MADIFDEREKAQEAKYKLDEEQRFKAEARRNKMLGRWAAQHMGLDEDQYDAYATEVVRVDLTEPGVMDVLRKVARDFAERGVDIGEDEILAELNRLYPLALAEITGEYLDALDGDHGRTGD